MSSGSSILSPAKINLHLQIGKLRDDGYHDLVSLFHMVSLYDQITLRSLKTNNLCRISGSFRFPPQENLIYKAYEAYRDHTGFDTGIQVDVIKRIPEGAGLGGGSSNAAFTLLLLNRLNRDALTSGELKAIAAQLGSDIPFFLSTPGAYVSGRGEAIERSPDFKSYTIVLTVPDIEINTRWAFSELDSLRSDGSVSNEADFFSKERLFSCIREESPKKWIFCNSFKPVLQKMEPISRAQTLMADCQAEFVNISGSGSSVYGLFSEKKDAERCFQRVKNSFTKTWLVNLLASYPAAY